MTIDVDKIVQDANSSYFSSISPEQEAILRTLCEPMTQEWKVKPQALGRGTYVFHCILGINRMGVRITRTGKVQLVRWLRKSALHTQTWTPEANDESRWQDGDLTFGWDRPASKDIVEFCRMWIGKTDAGTDELSVLRQQLTDICDSTSRRELEIARTCRQLEELEEAQTEEMGRFNRVVARIDELKAAKKGQDA